MPALRVAALAVALGAVSAGPERARSAAELGASAAQAGVFPGISVPLLRHRGHHGANVSGAGSPHRRAQDAVGVRGDYRALAYFYAVLYIGLPPQPFNVIVDTGSSLTAVPCDSCSACGYHGGNPPWSPAASTTARALACTAAGEPRPAASCANCSGDGACEFSLSYLESSRLRGALFTERAFFGDVSGVHAVSDRSGLPHAVFAADGVVVGCTTSEEGLFRAQTASGIAGLGAGPDSVVGALHTANVLRSYLFALCCAPEAGPDGTAGVLTLGEADVSLHAAPPAWVAMSTASGLYGVAVTDVAVGAAARAGPVWELAGGAGGGGGAVSAAVPFAAGAAGAGALSAVVDSGTTFSYLPAPAWEALVAAVTAWCLGSGSGSGGGGGGGGAGRCAGGVRVAPAPGSPDALCFALPPGDDAAAAAAVATLPAVSLTLAGAPAAGGGVGRSGGADVSITAGPAAAWLHTAEPGGVAAACLSFYSNGDRPGAVLGLNVMLGHDVVFDVEGGRLGWAPSTCGSDAAAGGGGGGGSGGPTVGAAGGPSAWSAAPGVLAAVVCGAVSALLLLAAALYVAVACCGARLACRVGRVKVLVPPRTPLPRGAQRVGAPAPCVRIALDDGGSDLRSDGGSLDTGTESRSDGGGSTATPPPPTAAAAPGAAAARRVAASPLWGGPRYLQVSGTRGPAAAAAAARVTVLTTSGAAPAPRGVPVRVSPGLAAYAAQRNGAAGVATGGDVEDGSGGAGGGGARPRSIRRSAGGGSSPGGAEGGRPVLL